MPKKFKGENSKAAVAKERKQAAKQEADDRRRKAEEDAYWRDDDKHVARKQERKADREKRKLEQQEKKLAAKELLAQEESELVGKSGGSSTKMTRAQIAADLESKHASKSSAAATPLPKGVTEVDTLLELNPNHELRQRQLEGEVDARNVDEAIAVLSVSKEAVDKHPEKRLKAAFTVFEEREMPLLKAEYPNLRLSQLKQLLRKEWMKSPENPMNQH